MTLRQLELFISIVKTGSFHRCAKEAFTTQSTVSQHIALLEAELGVQLLERSKRGIWLTEAGRLVFDRAQKVLGGVRSIEEEVRDLKGRMDISLRLGASSVPGTFILPTILTELTHKFPNLRTDVKLGSSSKVLDLLQNFECDIGIVGAMSDSGGVFYERLMEEELRLVVPPSHPFADSRKVGISELTDLSIIAPSVGSSAEQAVLSELSKVGAGLSIRNVRMRIDGGDGMKAAVAAGLGVSFLSTLTTRKEIERGELVEVEVEGLKIKRILYLARRTSAKLSPVAAAFWDATLNNCGGMRSVGLK